ncbi:MAG: alkaline phosphatase family protein, partial [Pseudomonadota bacterium]
MTGERAAVIGLDGVPFELLGSFIDAGIMPNTAEIARRGTFVKMETALPAVSAVAWTSFITGRNPGAHGIFGFTDLNGNEISLKLPSFQDVKVPTFWDTLPGIESLIVNVPFTYPAVPTRGVMISGFVAPVFERAVYPQSLIPWLRAKNYRIDVDSVKGRSDRHGLIRELFETLAVTEDVMLELV